MASAAFYVASVRNPDCLVMGRMNLPIITGCPACGAPHARRRPPFRIDRGGLVRPIFSLILRSHNNP